MPTNAMDTLRSILLDVLGIPEEIINGQAYLRKDLELDSTETVELSLELKRRLGINLKFESRSDKSLDEICSMIDQAMAVQPTIPYPTP